MDFRPSTTVKPIKCPFCAWLNSGITKKCSKCKADLVEFKQKG